MALPLAGQKWKAAPSLLLSGSVQIPWIFPALAVWGRWLCQPAGPCLLSSRALLKILSHQECRPQPDPQQERDCHATGENFTNLCCHEEHKHSCVQHVNCPIRMSRGKPNLRQKYTCYFVQVHATAKRA